MSRRTDILGRRPRLTESDWQHLRYFLAELYEEAESDRDETYRLGRQKELLPLIKRARYELEARGWIFKSSDPVPLHKV